jgi:hypothetical protein
VKHGNKQLPDKLRDKQVAADLPKEELQEAAVRLLRLSPKLHKVVEQCLHQ